MTKGELIDALLGYGDKAEIFVATNDAVMSIQGVVQGPGSEPGTENGSAAIIFNRDELADQEGGDAGAA